MQNSMRYDPMIERVINEYSDMVYKLAYARTKNKYDAEDVLQEVFLRYIRRKPVFQNGEHEKAWLLRVTINCSKNLFASFTRNRTISLIDNQIGVTDEERVLSEFLAKLPVKYLTIIHLFYEEDLKILDIARLLDLKESTVKMQLTRARRLLKEYIEMEEQNV
ncbi:MAG: sigma-70 family RNA polymerase sigma factor [Clostridiaceae bacterium]